MGILKIGMAIGLTALPVFGQNPTPSAPRVRVVAKGPMSYLGVNVLEVDSEIAKAAGLKQEHGVQITLVDPDSPAARSGLMVKDIILEYNNERVEGTTQFVRMVSETPVGRKVSMEVFRNGGIQTLTAQIGARPGQNFNFSMTAPMAPMAPMPPSPPNIDLTMPDIPGGLLSWQSSSLGYISEPVDGQLADFFGVKEGVLVRSVVAQSPAEKAGLKAGDVIVKADGMPVKSPREITGMLRRQRDNKKLSLTVVRSHKELTLELIAKLETSLQTLVL
jgi:serine protease Do